MAEPIDLSTFKPSTAQELAQGVLTNVLSALGKSANEATSEIENDLKEFGSSAFRTAQRLASGEIDEKKADALLSMQQIYLNQILMNAEFWTYVIAQRALDAATAVVKAAIKNITGVALNF